VLRSITGEYEQDGFEAMERLSRESGIPIPRGLSELRGARELHTDMIDIDGVFDYVQRKAREL
jgi:hypothetical protein